MTETSTDPVTHVDAYTIRVLRAQNRVRGAVFTCPRCKQVIEGPTINYALTVQEQHLYLHKLQDQAGGSDVISETASPGAASGAAG